MKNKFSHAVVTLFILALVVPLAVTGIGLPYGFNVGFGINVSA